MSLGEKGAGWAWDRREGGGEGVRLLMKLTFGRAGQEMDGR